MRTMQKHQDFLARLNYYYIQHQHHAQHHSHFHEAFAHLSNVQSPLPGTDTLLQLQSQAPNSASNSKCS